MGTESSGGKAAEAWRWPPTPSSAEVKERVELHLYPPPSGPSWFILGWTLPLHLVINFTYLNTWHYTGIKPHSDSTTSRGTQFSDMWSRTDSHKRADVSAEPVTFFSVYFFLLVLFFFPLSFIHIPSSYALTIFLLGMCHYKTTTSAATNSYQSFHGVMSSTSPIPSTPIPLKKYLLFYTGYGCRRFFQYVADRNTITYTLLSEHKVQEPAAGMNTLQWVQIHSLDFFVQHECSKDQFQ